MVIIPELKNLNGLNQEVYDYVFSFEQSNKMGEMICDFISTFLPFYQQEGKNELVVAVGCTSGHHRSVSFVKYVGDYLTENNIHTVTLHRDIDKEF